MVFHCSMLREACSEPKYLRHVRSEKQTQLGISFSFFFKLPFTFRGRMCGMAGRDIWLRNLPGLFAGELQIEIIRRDRFAAEQLTLSDIFHSGLLSHCFCKCHSQPYNRCFLLSFLIFTPYLSSRLQLIPLLHPGFLSVCFPGTGCCSFGQWFSCSSDGIVASSVTQVVWSRHGCCGFGFRALYTFLPS